MASVSESIVREYFELLGFFVRQQRKHVVRGRKEDSEVDFFVLHPQPKPREGALPFVLASGDLQSVARAVVAVKGWHTGSFSPGVLAHAPNIYGFVDPAVFRRAARAFAGEPAPLKILIVPALPQASQARGQSIDLLRSKGVDAVVPFPTILSELISLIEVNRDYQKSDVLQLMRILKNYDLFKDPQLELFRNRRKARRPAGNT